MFVGAQCIRLQQWEAPSMKEVFLIFFPTYSVIRKGKLKIYSQSWFLRKDIVF